MSTPSIYYDAVSELSPVTRSNKLITLFITNKTQVPETRFKLKAHGVETVESFRRDLATKLKQDPDLIQLMWGDDVPDENLIPLNNLMATLDSYNITNKSDIVVTKKEPIYLKIVGDKDNVTYQINNLSRESKICDLTAELRRIFSNYRHDLISVVIRGGPIAINDTNNNTTLESNGITNGSNMNLVIKMRILLQDSPNIRNRIPTNAPVFFDEFIHNTVGKLKQTIETSWGIPSAEQMLTFNGTLLSDDKILYDIYDRDYTTIDVDVLPPPPTPQTRAFLKRSGGTPPTTTTFPPFQNSVGSSSTFVPWQPVPFGRMSPPPGPGGVPSQTATKLRRTGGRRRTTKKRKNNRK